MAENGTDLTIELNCTTARSSSTQPPAASARSALPRLGAERIIPELHNARHREMKTTHPRRSCERTKALPCGQKASRRQYFRDLNLHSGTTSPVPRVTAETTDGGACC